MTSFAPDEKLRLFFALPLAEALHEPVAEVQARIRPCRAKVKWVSAENLHFTLKFLGETPAALVPSLSAEAERIARAHEPFEIAIRGAGAFPRPQEARAVWLGVTQGAEALCALAEELEESLDRAGLSPKEKRAFRAHLTVGRNKSRHRLQELADAINAEEDVQIGAMPVSQFVLMRSQLMPEGPIYTVVETFTLGS